MPIPPPPPSTADDRLPSELAIANDQITIIDRAIAEENAALRQVRARWIWDATIVLLTRAAHGWRHFLSRMGVPRILVVVTLAVVTTSTVFLVVDTTFGSRALAVYSAAVIGLAAVLVLMLLSVVPADEQLVSWKERATLDMTAIEAEESRSCATLASLRAQQVPVQRKRAALESRWAVVQSSRDHRSRQLLAEPWKELRDYAFEGYLARVFENLGYHVEQKGQSGDQGVDLIVTKEGIRIAIQAKGYISSVGNSAIQEVFTGSRIHDCTVYAVITNSRFTSGAITAAEATGCLLIHEDNFADFVTGKIQFVRITSAAAIEA